MENGVKNKIMPWLIVLIVILLVLAAVSCNSVLRLKNTMKELDKQKLASWDFEQKFNKVSQEKSAMEDKLKAENKQFQEQKDELEATKKTLTQQQLIGQSLTEELEKLNKQKEIQQAKPSEKPSGAKAVNINK